MRHTRWIPPFALCCVLACANPVAAQQVFTYAMEDQSVKYDPAKGTGSLQEAVNVTEDPSNLGYPNAATMFKIGVANDPALLVPVAAAAAGGIADVNGGSGPYFFDVDISLESDFIFVTAIFAIDFSLAVTLDGPMVEISYDLNAETLLDATDATETALVFVPTDIFDPANLVVFEFFPGGVAGSVIPELDGAIITLVPFTTDIDPPSPAFLRGDASGNGDVSALLDALFILNWQFAGGAEPPCLDAADIDGNNIVQPIIDALTLLSYQFDSGPPPAAPGTEVCGVDPDAATDGVDCAAVATACLD